MAQTKVSGMISDARTKEPLVGVSVQIKGKIIGTITDLNGKFDFTTATPVPFQLVISSVGYKSQEYTLKSENAAINISLEEENIMGQELVVSASRMEESVMKSPVSVEKLDLRAIRETTAPNFYDALGNMKGVDLTTQGLLFKSINMRGFNSTGNVRTVQMIDGMDNQAPGLNFPVDNIVGMPELDVESVELVSGAASALYGPNALNGLVLMNSKSPFLYQGLSANIKSGIMSASNRAVQTTPFYDMSLRYAKAFNNKVAFKVNLSYLGAKDWEANSTDNLNYVKGGANDRSALDYDGLNVYGDEVQTNLGTVADALVKGGLLPANARGLVPNTIVSRTGYSESDLMDYNTKSFKVNAALHYRITEKIEAIGQINYGYGTTVYTGTGRYGLRNFNIMQGKLELRGDNFTLRGYTTQENSGQSFLAGLTAVDMLNEAKPHANWFGEYVGAFVQAKSLNPNISEANAHATARAFADKNMPQPGSDQFNTLLDKYREMPISKGGSAFTDKTDMYHAEGFYNFKNQIKFIDLIAGANVRQYRLKSDGTLFSDTKDGRDGVIPINEYGAFTQASKNLFGDHLKLIGSIRYDKNQNFDGQFTPRVSAISTFGNHNIRASYQTGFRIPTTQNQYIDLTTPTGTLVGGMDEFNARYNLTAGIPRNVLADFQINGANSKYLDAAAKQKLAANVGAFVTSNLSAIQSAVIAAVQAGVVSKVTAAVQALVAAGQLPAEAAPAAIQAQVTAQMGSQAVKDLITANVTSQANALATQVTPAFALDVLPKYSPVKLQPERIKSWEIGYKGLIGKKLFVDTYYYSSVYSNFIGGTVIVVPTAPAAAGLPLASGIGVGNFKGYQRVSNTSEKITADGWALGLNYSLPKGYSIGGNWAVNRLKNFVATPEQQYAGFNSPKNRYNVNFAKRLGSGEKFGFNVSARYQDAFVWESSFVVPTTSTVPLFGNTTVPSIFNIDAQVSYKLPAVKSVIKLGGTNIGGKPYVQAYGSAYVGSMYYVSIAYDELFNR
ncbi:MAG: carboxypeptidase-like regulatory domain-containing protein [Cytophagaceae bacterium]|nr:carboxypeptidase-like regulatory domain-containing protein [Cytophagaceae bacterium]MBL0324113.1 carboxypeptidase-like regulatory domain-containing protein [Cytophagaceae bacterium]